jgi:hypothetical protein
MKPDLDICVKCSDLEVWDRRDGTPRKLMCDKMGVCFGVERKYMACNWNLGKWKKPAEGKFLDDLMKDECPYYLEYVVKQGKK